MEITNELIICLKKFKEVFGDVAPLRELPSTVTEKDLIEAIKKSIKEGENLLPHLFRYDMIETKKIVKSKTCVK